MLVVPELRRRGARPPRRDLLSGLFARLSMEQSRRNRKKNMATQSVTARELAALVKPVRALLTKKNKEAAVMLVRKRTKCGLEESKEFVEHVESRPAARAQDVAELWIGVTLGEAAADAAQCEPQPAATSKGELMKAREMTDAKGMSLADWYAQYMLTHTYPEWEQFVERCIAVKRAEEEL
jgi:ribosomal protein L7/L12